MNDIERVRQLSEEIGYGHLMSLASSLWREKLKETGIPLEGAFIPVIRSFVVEDKEIEDIVDKSTKHYDRIVKNGRT